MITGSTQRMNTFKAGPNLLIGNVKLKRVKNKKILVVVIDQSLGWHDHIDSVCKKVKKGLGVLRRIRDVVPGDSLIKVFHVTIQPHFDYCSLYNSYIIPSRHFACRMNVEKMLDMEVTTLRGESTQKRSWIWKLNRCRFDIDIQC